jgi:Carboxymuconolactone decarboxylase family
VFVWGAISHMGTVHRHWLYPHARRRTNRFEASRLAHERWAVFPTRVSVSGRPALGSILARDCAVVPPDDLVKLNEQCPYCLDVHARNAKKAGATREEVTEASFIAAALRAGAAVTHCALALKLFDNA